MELIADSVGLEMRQPLPVRSTRGEPTPISQLQQRAFRDPSMMSYWETEWQLANLPKASPPPDPLEKLRKILKASDALEKELKAQEPRRVALRPLVGAIKLPSSSMAIAIDPRAMEGWIKSCVAEPPPKSYGVEFANVADRLVKRQPTCHPCCWVIAVIITAIMISTFCFD